MKALIYFGLIVGCLIISTKASDGTWQVMNDDKNVTCLIAEMSIKANFSYTSKDNATKAVQYEIPLNQTKVDDKLSKCDVDDTLVVSWGIGNSFTLLFKVVNESYELSNFVINFNASDILPDAAENQSVSIKYSKESTFMTRTKFSYHCNREQTLNATDSEGEKLILVSKVQLEAFKVDNSGKYSLGQDCDSKIKPDIVPIAVGLSLIALIVVVLIGFIVGRRRQQARGYLNIM